MQNQGENPQEDFFPAPQSAFRRALKTLVRQGDTVRSAEIDQLAARRLAPKHIKRGGGGLDISH
ncbi:hypothetical protein D3C84_1143520 [compost metagenome]